MRPKLETIPAGPLLSIVLRRFELHRTVHNIPAKSASFEKCMILIVHFLKEFRMCLSTINTFFVYMPVCTTRTFEFSFVNYLSMRAKYGDLDI